MNSVNFRKICRKLPRILRRKVRDIYLVRHGESPQNIFLRHIRERTHGVDELRSMYEGMGHSRWLGLTDFGIEQARWAGQWLREEFREAKPEILITASPYRARETAGYIHLEMRLGKELWKEDLCFDERNWGSYDHLGHPSFFNGEYDILRDFFREHAIDLGPPDGESLKDLYIRATQRLQHLIDTRRIFGKTLIVSHYDTIGCLGVWLRGGRVEELWKVDKLNSDAEIPQNGSIFHYTRTNPSTGKLADKLRWVRKVCPWDRSKDMPWTEILSASYRHGLSVEDLLRDH